MFTLGFIFVFFLLDWMYLDSAILGKIKYIVFGSGDK